MERYSIETIKQLIFYYFIQLFYTIGSVPKAANYWQEDRFYGFQFLNGCNPESIKRCTKLPSNFPVTQELVGNLLDEGDTLMEAMEVTFPAFFP